MARDSLSQAVGIVLIVFGILLLVGSFSISSFLPYAGILLIILGVLILVNVLPGGLLLGVAVLIVGILLVQGLVSLPKELRELRASLTLIINIVLGVILLLLGIQKVRS